MLYIIIYFIIFYLFIILLFYFLFYFIFIILLFYLFYIYFILFYYISLSIQKSRWIMVNFRCQCVNPGGQGDGSYSLASFVIRFGGSSVPQRHRWG